MRLRPFLSACLLSLPLLSQAAAARTCLVVGISDGDTLTARCGRIGSYEEVRVRIAAIDAPESAQPYGRRARQALSKLCYFERALITERDTDRYGRTVADVNCDGQDVATWMVSEGWAWVYDYRGSAERYGGRLEELQRGARTQRQGLWAGARPTPPWKWRQRQRENASSGFPF
ncbi:endonuclease YncB(thermonuclease family) [Variovorax sp. TBS-050B]|uniref:thermonuclease family protein n=1 Tax=Variovorax sp. TBS-050B TaxID=2940551 RepID=UPI002475C8DE|nr:thermonuclease family protein [Variovorax sp. TBS-050B]MDH6593579.1 endonuclease YncB(thermonuclease family) [Variovorax sp. TBS-050B]